MPRRQTGSSNVIRFRLGAVENELLQPLHLGGPNPFLEERIQKRSQFFKFGNDVMRQTLADAACGRRIPSEHGGSGRAPDKRRRRCAARPPRSIGRGAFGKAMAQQFAVFRAQPLDAAGECRAPFFELQHLRLVDQRFGQTLQEGRTQPDAVSPLLPEQLENLEIRDAEQPQAAKSSGGRSGSNFSQRTKLTSWRTSSASARLGTSVRTYAYSRLWFSRNGRRKTRVLSFSGRSSSKRGELAHASSVALDLSIPFIGQTHEALPCCITRLFDPPPTSRSKFFTLSMKIIFSSKITIEINNRII